jgi:hypothetical protein
MKMFAVAEYFRQEAISSMLVNDGWPESNISVVLRA